MVAAIGILCAPQFGILTFGTVFLHDVLHAGVGATTGALVGLQCGAMAMRVWSDRWTDRHGNRAGFLRAATWISLFCFVMLGLLSWLLARTLADGPLVLAAMLVALAVSGVCVSAWHGVAYAELVTLAGAHKAGTALGMANTSVFVVCFATASAIPHINALACGWLERLARRWPCRCLPAQLVPECSACAFFWPAPNVRPYTGGCYSRACVRMSDLTPAVLLRSCPNVRPDTGGVSVV